MADEVYVVWSKGRHKGATWLIERSYTLKKTAVEHRNSIRKNGRKSIIVRGRRNPNS